MAGEIAQSVGWSIVPDAGVDGARVRWGAREINVTRDYAAGVKLAVPTTKDGFRTATGISSGVADPTGGNDGDIYFKIL